MKKIFEIKISIQAEYVKIIDKKIPSAPDLHMQLFIQPCFD